MRLSYVFILMLVVSLPGCIGRTPNFWADAKPNQKKILVTFPPLYSITHAVAGEDAYVLSMLTTQGPHGYEGAITDLFMVEKADLLISNGLTLDDDFIEKKLLRNHKNTKLVTLNVGEALLDKPGMVLKGDGAWHVMPDGSKHKHGEHDPHIWLGPKQAMEMTRVIRDKLVALDLDHKAGYEKRADAFIGELKNLQTEGEAAFKGKKNKKVVTMHEAFAYFAKAFDLEVVASIQKNPGTDPDGVSQGKLITLCQKPDGPRVIAVEPQYSKGPPEALKSDLALRKVEMKIVTLDPLETVKSRNPDPDYYLQEMRRNIKTLAEALP